MKQLLTRTITLLLVAFAAIIAPASAAAANGPSGLQVSPAIVEINAERGKTYEIKIRITNNTVTDINYYANVNDFRAKDETGNPELITDNTAPSSASIVKWIEPIAPFMLNPNQAKEIIAKMVVPNDAEPGGHYGVIKFGNQPPSIAQTGASLTASAGPLLLVRVDGVIKENLTVTDFYAQRKDKKATVFENGPVVFVERLTNSGSVHVRPSGSILVSDMFGRQIAELNINDKKGNVLPNSTRRFDQSLNRKWMFGRYTAKMVLSYGTSGGALDSVITFWVIPYKLIALAILILVLIIFLFKKALNRYKKKIVESALKEKQQTTPDKKD